VSSAIFVRRVFALWFAAVLVVGVTTARAGDPDTEAAAAAAELFSERLDQEM
jgi:hypothetical protein